LYWADCYYDQRCLTINALVHDWNYNTTSPTWYTCTSDVFCTSSCFTASRSWQRCLTKTDCMPLASLTVATNLWARRRNWTAGWCKFRGNPPVSMWHGNNHHPQNLCWITQLYIPTFNSNYRDFATQEKNMSTGAKLADDAALDICRALLI